MSPHFHTKEFEFLEEAAELVIRARRCIAYTYAIRFYLKGSLRQQFFDLQQSMLEQSLEYLNKKNEEPWEKRYLDVDEAQRMSVGANFHVFKRDLCSLMDTVEKYFGSLMLDIEADLPNVPRDGENDDVDILKI